MNMLSQGFPKAQMMVCGVLGPKSNAHGPNEFLHVPYAKKLTAAVAQVVAAMAANAPMSGVPRSRLEASVCFLLAYCITICANTAPFVKCLHWLLGFFARFFALFVDSA